ncbi:hypothetical protein [Natronosalvus vescus]|uniref:hypothetical protein n=1 Tax=Natronosalvus vescus TaxID=2953881 RepID=UPI0020912EFA|nr:hypothetical protein [Natronosalvus vescus]
MSDDRALERQADALEAIATELRYQNAVLVEIVAGMDDLSARVDQHHCPEGPPRDRSGTALQTWIQDRLFERDQLEDGDRDYSATWGRADNWGESDD